MRFLPVVMDFSAALKMSMERSMKDPDDEKNYVLKLARHVTK